MTIERLDKDRVLISLKIQDMAHYAISIDKLNIKDEESKEVLKNLIKTALDKANIKAENRAVLVEAMPHKEGMFILITVGFAKNPRKIYKIKKPKMQPVCKFASSEGLLSCVEKLKDERINLLANSLWQYKEDFYVIFEYTGISPKGAAVLSEYSLCQSLSLASVARIKEAGKEILPSNAVEIIAKSM